MIPLLCCMSIKERTVRVEVDIDVRSPLGIGLTNSATIGHLKANTQFNVRAAELSELEAIPKLMEELTAQVKESTLATATTLASGPFTPEGRGASSDTRLSPKDGDVDHEVEDEAASETSVTGENGEGSETGATACATNTSYKRLALHAVVPGSRIVSVRPKAVGEEDESSKEELKATCVESLAELSGALQKCRDGGVNNAVLELDVPTAGMSPAQILYAEAPLGESYQMSLLDKVGLVCLLADMATVHPVHLDLFATSPPNMKKQEEGELQICPWYRLNALFFAHPKSDMLSNSYFRLFEVAVRNNHTSSMRYLFVGDACFFGRLVAPLTRHPDEFTHPIDAPHEMLNNDKTVNGEVAVAAPNGMDAPMLPDAANSEDATKRTLTLSRVGSREGKDGEQERERQGSEDSIMSSVSNFSSYSSSAHVICLPTAAPGLPISQALRFCQVLRECCDDHPETSFLSSTLRKHALWTSEVLPRLGVLEGAWNDHGMGIHVERGDDDSDSYSDEDEHIAVESIGDAEVEEEEEKAAQKEQCLSKEEESESDSGSDEEVIVSSVIHEVEVDRSVMAPLLELTNGSYEVIVKKSDGHCISFHPVSRKWKHTKKLKRVDSGSKVETKSKTVPTEGVMTREEEEWCAEQKSKDEINLQKELTKKSEEEDADAILVHDMESALTESDALVEAHVEAENIFFAPFNGNPELTHFIDEVTVSTPTKKYSRRASEIRPLTIISPERLKPTIRRHDGKVSGQMSPIKAPKRSPRSPRSPKTSV